MPKTSLFILLIAVLLNGCGPSQIDADKSATPSSKSSSTVPASPSSPASSSSTSPCSGSSLDANRKIALTAPCDGATVAQREFVEGLVADPNSEVSVVVHAMETSDYWIQPDVTMRAGGKWKVLCYFGEAGPQHSGKHFEIMAVVMSQKGQYREGQLVHGWPPGQAKSEVLEVVRK